MNPRLVCPVCGGPKGRRSRRCRDCAFQAKMDRGAFNIDKRLSARLHVDENGCWIWQGALDVDGYGKISVRGKQLYTHRVMYEIAFGPIPEGLQLDHLCRTPACMRPAHLEAVTCAENVQRGNAAKLTKEQVRVIRTSGEPTKVLVDRYGVGRRTISHVRSGGNWVGV